MKKPELKIKFCGKTFENPFLLSSSPVSNTAEMVERSFEAGWAGVAFKTIHAGKQKIIHPSPRMNAYHYGTSRITGLQNVEQISDREPDINFKDITYLKKNWPEKIIISSIMGFSTDEWKYLAKASEQAGADMLELNFSCPHMTVEGSGYKVGQADELITLFTRAVKDSCSLPVIAKMTPNITDITEPALAAKIGGADAVSAINTIRAISEIDIYDEIPRPNVFGKSAISGYSGPAVKPIALRFITELAQCRELNLPISGMGGLETWIDALEFILCGASTLQVTTSIIRYGYRVVEDMKEGLLYYMEDKEISDLKELVGRSLRHIVNTHDFNLKRKYIARYDNKKCIGCGQCYIVCNDSGGQALVWDEEKRLPVLDEQKCLSCMVCSFVCPVNDVITFREEKIKRS
jgi:dihydropyrimidine dehydrogenase (NAD+) subunit PreA